MPTGPAIGLVSYPAVLHANPYQRLLYRELARHGVVLVGDAPFKLGWLRRARGSVRVLHFHWPQAYWTHERGPHFLRHPFSYAKVALFAFRLSAARALGYKIVWTVHQVYPHERSAGRLDRLGARALARYSDLLLAHDRGTVATMTSELGRYANKRALVPHGSYADVYPPGRARDIVRAELGLPPDSFAFLSFGDLRAYKGVSLALQAVAETDAPRIRLVVTGGIVHEDQAEAVRAAAAMDARIVEYLGFVPDKRVAELFGACDAALVSRSDGGTSGSLILALSLGLPAVAARQSAYEDLLGGEEAGWLFDPGDAGSLARTLARAATADRETLEAKRAAVRRRLDDLGWDQIGARTAALIRKVAS
jgi:glycosyltransferase involved in cell wall biosynthesis